MNLTTLTPYRADVETDDRAALRAGASPRALCHQVVTLFDAFPHILGEMAPWGYVAGVYGAWIACSAFVRLRGRRRWAVFVAGALYAAAGACLATATLPVMHLIVPGAALLLGYWLSGPFFDRPQPGLEQWLLNVDRRASAALAWTAHAPRWTLEGLETIYAADYLVVGGGALLMWPLGVDTVIDYWSTVLPAELACYAALPWIRTRPPRVLEPPGPLDLRDVTMRRLNAAVLHRASVQANTLPSGHVAGAGAAALAISAYFPVTGAILLVVAALIAVSAFVGRYHYLVDVVLGGVVAVIVAILI